MENLSIEDYPILPKFLKRGTKEYEMAKKEGKEKAAKKAKESEPVKKNAKPTKSKKSTVEKPVKTAKAKKGAVEKDVFGFKKGSKRSQAAELYAKKSGKVKGATLSEIKKEIGSSQLNLLKDLEKQGYKIEKNKEPGAGKKSVTRYYIAGKGK